MSGPTCWLSQRLGLVEPAVAVALRSQAEGLAAAIGMQDGALQIAIVEDAGGLVIQALGAGLAAREFGSARAAPFPVLGAVVAERRDAVAAAVGAAVARALGGR